MKNLKIWFAFFLAGVFLTSCQPEDYSMGEKLDPSEIDYEIIQDYDIDAGGNTVILKFNTPGATPVWNYGTGKSSRVVDTVRFAFQGDYEIDLNVITAGGVVDLDPVTISVTEDNLSYVDDPLWTKLTGGNGESKTWVLDLDEEGTSIHFVGPLYFYGTDNGWLEGGGEWDGGATGCYEEGGDCWNWSPEWSGNTWLMPAGDYGSMTFSLEGGPYVTVNHNMLPSLGEQSGTFFLDKDAHMINLNNDVEILHSVNNDECVNDWSNVRVMSLTEDTMQLGVLRRDDCDGAALLVYNFVSEEFKENYVPEEVEPTIDEGFDPEFESGELLQMLTGGPSSGRIWELDAEGNPVDWIASGIGWTENADSSRDWGWNAGWDEAAADSWIRFDQWGGMNYTRYQNGMETSGTFSINEETNEITLVNNTLIQGPEGHWMNPTTHVIKVIKAYDDFQSRGIWFGTSYNADSDEWLAFHYILGGNEGNGDGEGTTEPIALNFDNSKLAIGDIEENGNLRLELFNEYGSTMDDPGLTRSDVAFSEKVEITFSLSGITLNEDAAGSYDAKIYFADGDWAPQGDGNVITVNGDGTYTVTYEAPSPAQGTFVFVIDVVGLAADLADMDAVSANIEEIIMY
ncbi:hypothetical protein RM549_07960 [Salegentibacter sp. F188]|uniref:PKD domain-containing protein n=1 Tax=Autumnicola patrickiae TaxID=3075591 RepID=A0ABU3E1A2_9FLAO|nr:hypothetical protein [Salegentibacter sp. F188]MDT0689717.1 hypothetical protein [Salegentibacter sp. F188]